VELDRPAAPVVEKALASGLLINRTADTVIRLLPPFIITELEVDEMAELFSSALGDVCSEGRS
jgi:acetylornithine aminotransferase